MCGIVAELGERDSLAGARMLRRLTHRGPDGEGSAAVGGSWLGHRRLAIVDLEGGDQPLRTHDGELWLVGNGEIYNHADVRRSIGSSEFETRSDNEAALQLIQDRGPSALGALSGMFAFVAAGADGRFVAARDPVGIKPLYWARRNGSVRFASEMQAFDPEWLPSVAAFPPGHYWSPDAGLVRFAQAVPNALAPIAPNGGAYPASVLAETRDVLIGAVESQMMGDVPVGVFLSGGLDSSLVAAIAARWLRARGQRLQTFAVGTAGSPDLVAARRAAQYLDTDHHEWVYTAEDALTSVAEVVRVIEHFDASLVRSAVPNHMLARLASRHVKVVLTGEGADEIFAGYEYQREIADPDELHAEVVRTIEGLHNLNLQRCDRVTMAHGLEARVPFLDREVIGFGVSLPAEWKVAAPGEMEKRLLREAFAGWLPEDLLWRQKSQFGDGSGAADVLTDALASEITDAELGAELGGALGIRTKEELAYYRMWRDNLQGVDVSATLGRFATA